MKIKKIISIILFSLVICLLYTVRVDAASVSISASSTSVTVGTKVTITASGTAASWDLSISGSGISTTSIAGNTSDAENGSFSKSVSFTPNSAGTYTFKLTGNMMDESATDYDNDIITVNKSVTITAKAKTSSSSSNGSSSSNSSSGKESSSSSSSKSSNTSNAPSFSSVNETVYATDSVNVRSSYSTSSSVIGSLEKGDSVTRTGKSSSWSRVTYNGRTAYISSQYLTTEKPEESANKDLKELTVEGDYELTPEFSKDVTEYDLTVGEDVEAIEINAVTDDDAAKVEITGADKLLMGINTVEIKVTAEDGTEKTYKINVTRGKVEPLGLSELTIEGYTLTPEFNSEVYEYTLDIPDLSVTSLNINAISNMENATVEITGEDNLIQGENVITILIKSEDGESTATYQITANVHEPEPEKTQLIAGIDDEDLFLYGGIAIGVIIVIIIIIVVIRHNRKKDDDFGTYYGGFDSLNRDVKNDNIDASENNTNQVDLSNNLESNVEDKTKSERKNVIEENFGADVDTNRFDDDTPKRRRGKHF